MNPTLQSPYPGLRAFEPDESSIFFGRGEHIGAMIRILRRERFLAVVGASGSGKSSLVRAGLLPAIAEGYLGGDDWRFILVRPGKDPYRNLADALIRATEFEPRSPGLPLPPPPETVQIDDQHLLFRTVTLRNGPNGLIDALMDSPLPDGTGVVVSVDQFEEIFRFRESTSGFDNSSQVAEALAFVDMLLETVRNAPQSSRPIFVILTMRSDYFGECSAFLNLPEAINRSQFLTPSLTHEQLRDVIVRPLTRFDCGIDHRVVNQLLNDVGTRQDQLPLLQHLLLRMWQTVADARTGGDRDEAAEIEFDEHYQVTGGLARCLDQHATALYLFLADMQSDAPQQVASRNTSSRQRIAQRLFRCLSDRSPQGQLNRRLTTVQEVADVADERPDEVIAVVEVFRQPGVHFLVTSPEGALTAATNIDVSHESLLRQWGMLQEWIAEEAEAAAGYRRLMDAVEEEDVITGVRLDRAVEWRETLRPNTAWAQRYEILPASHDSEFEAQSTEIESESSPGKENQDVATSMSPMLQRCLALIDTSVAARDAAEKRAEDERRERAKAAEDERRRKAEAAALEREKRVREEAQARELELAKNLAEEQKALALALEARARLFRRMLAVVGILAVAAACLFLFANSQRTTAETERGKAETERGKAETEREKAELALADAKVDFADNLRLTEDNRRLTIDNLRLREIVTNLSEVVIEDLDNPEFEALVIRQTVEDITPPGDHPRNDKRITFRLDVNDRSIDKGELFAKVKHVIYHMDKRWFDAKKTRTVDDRTEDFEYSVTAFGSTRFHAEIVTFPPNERHILRGGYMNLRETTIFAKQ